MRSILQILATVLLGAIVFASLSQAGEPASPPRALHSTEMRPESGFATEVVDETASPRPLHSWGKNSGTPSLADRWRNRVPILCFGNFNHYSCGSLHSECRFLFGSCRQFFGEKCLKAPPPSIIPGYDPAALGLDDRGHCPGCR